MTFQASSTTYFGRGRGREVKRGRSCFSTQLKLNIHNHIFISHNNEFVFFFACFISPFSFQRQNMTPFSNMLCYQCHWFTFDRMKYVNFWIIPIGKWSTATRMVSLFFLFLFFSKINNKLILNRLNSQLAGSCFKYNNLLCICDGRYCCDCVALTNIDLTEQIEKKS